MCNDFGNHIPYSDYLAAFSQTRIPVRWPKAAPNLEPREDIWPTDKAPVVRRLEDGTNEFAECDGAFRLLGPRERPSSIFARRNGGFRLADVSSRRRISSSSPGPNRRSRSGNLRRLTR